MTSQYKTEIILPTILRLPEVKLRSGLSRSTIYAYISQGLWPKPVSLGVRAVGWPENEIAAINAARIAGKSNDEIRKLINNLETARKTLLHQIPGYYKV